MNKRYHKLLQYSLFVLGIGLLLYCGKKPAGTIVRGWHQTNRYNCAAGVNVLQHSHFIYVTDTNYVIVAYIDSLTRQLVVLDSAKTIETLFNTTLTLFVRDTIQYNY